LKLFFLGRDSFEKKKERQECGLKKAGILLDVWFDGG